MSGTKQMGVEISSDWMIPRLEILKNLYDLTYKGYNEEIGFFLFNNENASLLILADNNGKTNSLNASNANSIEPLIDSKNYDEVFIIATNQTKVAFETLKNNEKITIITSNTRIQLTEKEILEVFNNMALHFCLKKCDVKTINKEECKATKKGAISCPIRNRIDNAKFHATMRWRDQLLNDFIMLTNLDLQNEGNIIS